MSAHMASRDNFILLAVVATTMRHGQAITDFTVEQANLIADDLQRENIASIKDRYEHNPEAIADMTGGVPDHVNITWREYDQAQTFASENRMTVIKVAQYVDYQSCEHDDWQQSRARERLIGVIAHCVSKLPGYDAAPWGINDGTIASVKAISLSALANSH